MKLKFGHKLFLTFLLNGLVVVFCMVLIARAYAIRNFEDYVNKVAMERLDELATTLSREYGKSGGWESVLAGFGGRFDGRGPGHFSRGEAPGGPPVPFGPPPPPPWDGKDPGHGEPPPFDRPLPRGSMPPGPPPHGPHIALFNAEKHPLTEVGPHSSDDYQLRPIRVDDRLVGWLGMRRPEHLTHPLDVEFLKVQVRTFYAAGGIALLLAVLLTLVVSRRLLAPVKELAEGTRALTSRRFDTRIEVRSADELGQLAVDFNDMARALERYERLRRQWVADIAHELRTPLAVLRGEIEAMQDGVRDMNREALDSLHFEVLHLGRIVRDLHELSLIESRTFDVEPSAMRPLEVLEETLRSFQTRFDRRGIRIESIGEATAEVTILADADRLKQLFSNLLENTLRYASSPGVLTISRDLTRDDLSLGFEDSGPGVPEESLDRLFDRLYRVDKARSRAQGGSGLGLAICKSIVECFGGRIEASNVPSGGLRIVVVFPTVST